MSLDVDQYPLSITIATYLRGERAHRRWTQDRMAEELGRKKSWLADVESQRRRVTFDEVGLICVRLGVSLPDALKVVPDGDAARVMLGV